MQRSSPRTRAPRASHAPRRTAAHPKRRIGTTARPTNRQISRRAFSTEAAATKLKHTPFYQQHLDANGSMVDYCGWALPVRYKASALAAHNHVRNSAGLFDVSHMGQVHITGTKRIEFLEKLTPADLTKIRPYLAKLSVLTNEQGGVVDDCMITKREDDVYMVINAGCVDKDLKHMNEQLEIFNNENPDAQPVHINYIGTRGLLALQGPKAVDIMKTLFPTIEWEQVGFMNAQHAKLEVNAKSIPMWITRCGYTGEDGFEMGCEPEDAADVWNAILGYNNETRGEVVLPIGLGVRDSLRFEAGLCLYGHELNQTVSPVEAGLSWVISPRRKIEGGFLGAQRVLDELANGAPRKLVGLIAAAGGVPREHMKIVHPVTKQPIGETTSGGCAPSLDNKRIAMAYLDNAAGLAVGDSVSVEIRGKESPMEITTIPFVQTHYYRVPKKQ